MLYFIIISDEMKLNKNVKISGNWKTYLNSQPTLNLCFTCILHQTCIQILPVSPAQMQLHFKNILSFSPPSYPSPMFLSL